MGDAHEATREAGLTDGVAAARRGDVAALERWLRAGGDPNRHDAGGWTPLLAAAVRGHDRAVALLLENWWAPANPDLPHRVSGALAIHLAGHAGSVAVAERVLARRPEHLDAIWDVNGHTLLLQAAFYGHLDLARYALKRGASTEATTLRGLTPLDMARQFQNEPMIALLAPHEPAPERKAAAHRAVLARVALAPPPEEAPQQELADALVAAVDGGLRRVAVEPDAAAATLSELRDLCERRGADPNRLGGALLQPPLVVAVTGNDGIPRNPRVAGLRLEIARYLLERGADPTLAERHPMAVHAFIRAAVFNHLEILKRMAGHVSKERLAAALNERPMVNGLTGFHDTVLRASTADPERFEGYLAQVRWFVESGARSDIEDFSGRTQRSIAERAANPEVRRRLLEALGS